MGDGVLRVGIIGCGQLGAIHAKRLAALTGVEVAALSDPSEAAMGRAAEGLPAPPGLRSADYRALLDVGLDALCIASPDAYHVPQALDALAAGLHVLCEKPLTLDPGDLDALIASRDEVGRHFMLTQPRHFSGGARAMRREIQSGQWGRVKDVALYNCEDWITPNVGTWRHDPSVCPGGFLYDSNIHQIDAALWTSGLQAEWVRATVDTRGTPVPIAAWGEARLVGGVPLTFHFVGDARHWHEMVEVHCEGRDFAIEDFQALWSVEGKFQPIEPPEPNERAEEAFVRLVRGEGANWAPAEDAWPVLRFTRAALESSRLGGVPADVG